MRHRHKTTLPWVGQKYPSRCIIQFEAENQFIHDSDASYTDRGPIIDQGDRVECNGGHLALGGANAGY